MILRQTDPQIGPGSPKPQGVEPFFVQHAAAPAQIRGMVTPRRYRISPIDPADRKNRIP